MSLNVSTLISTSAILIIQMAESMRVAQRKRKKNKHVRYLKIHFAKTTIPKTLQNSTNDKRKFHCGQTCRRKKKKNNMPAKSCRSESSVRYNEKGHCPRQVSGIDAPRPRSLLDGARSNFEQKPQASSAF